ncbi:hypothetical protein NDA14_004865 [Ustilago hordei]|nr:hypothetical protein NDA14_004865 [Ustilago hordei]
MVGLSATQGSAAGATRPPTSVSRNGRNKKRALLRTLSLLSVLILAAAPAAVVAAASCRDGTVISDPSSSSSPFNPAESLTETLLLKPLPDGRILSSFTFALCSASSSPSNFRLLPRTLLQPIQNFGVSEVHLSLNSGRWRYSSWGSPVTTLKNRNSYDLQSQQPGSSRGGEKRVKVGEESVGPGAELWAIFDEGVKDEEVRKGWKGLTSALAGLFCASLDAIDERQTVQPHYAYSSQNAAASNKTSQTIHALVPTENVCTENLTPFLKLLPCKGAAGLATLLNPLSLFSADFHGLAVHVERQPPAPTTTNIQNDSTQQGWKVALTFTAVFSPAVTRDISVRDWSLSSLFGRKLESTCPLSDESVIRVLKPSGTGYVVEPLPSFPACFVPGAKDCGGAKGKAAYLPVLGEEDEVTDELASAGLLAYETEQEQQEYDERLKQRWAHYLENEDGEYLYDLSSRPGKAVDISMRWPNETRFAYPASTPLSSETGQVVGVERALVGAGQQRATLQVVLTNSDPRLAQRVLWYETLGYFVRPYLHTLKHETQFLESTSNTTEDAELLRSVADLESPIEELTYQPATGKRGERKPFVLEGVIRMPAQSKVVLRMELRKQFVPYSQHPPDAHRGFDLNSAIVFPLAPVDPREAILLAQHRQASGSSKRIVVNPPRTNSWLDAIKNYIAGEAQIKQRETEQAPPPPPPPPPPPAAALRNAKAKARAISKSQSRIYTLPRLVELATPDFSFVYTNIIFTSTIIALFFGSTLNTLLRTFTDFVM